MSNAKARVVLVICDGLGDRPVPELGDLTPLEAANTPNMDALAASGQCGSMFTIRRGIVPGSDVAHLSLFGYDPALYYGGRGPIEAAGIGFKLEAGDVALRANFATVNDDLSIADRRAGRIRDVTKLVGALQGYREGDTEVLIRPGTAHRAVIIVRGKGLSSAISDNDPHSAEMPATLVRANDTTETAKKTACVLNGFLKWARQRLVEHPVNLERERSGLLAANYLLVRGAGLYKEVPSFSAVTGMSACCIAGGGLYRGIGAFLGMEIISVPGATALPDTDITAKFVEAIRCINKYDLVFVHVKAADSLGEDGNYDGKKCFIEKIDASLKSLREGIGSNLIVLTADHSTPCSLKTHSADSVPVLFSGYGIRPDNVKKFGERAVTSGGLGFFTGRDLIPQILNAVGRYQIFGG